MDPPKPQKRQIHRHHKGGVAHISDMRIVLLGNRRVGKSSSGNTILDRKEFNISRRTAQCVKKEKMAAGRHITVVEAPGWWKNYTVEETPKRDKREIILSVSLCPPGPHALLLVIRVDTPLIPAFRRALQDHVQLLGEGVWSHTMVLFTCGDRLEDTSIEQHIKSGGEDLHWVLAQCGNRYHVLDNTISGSQVSELLEKIEEMVAGNSGRPFHFDEEEVQKLIDEKREEERRAQERKMTMQRKREALRSSIGGVAHIKDMRIVLLGNRREGKSSSGDTILSREEFDTSGTDECVKKEGMTAGRYITVVEAPGWWKCHNKENTPETHKQQIIQSVSLCPPGPHALLLVIDVSTSITETHVRAVQQHLELLGDGVWSYTMVLFTCGDWLGDTSIEQHIESGGKDLQWVVEECGNRYHVFNNKKSDGGQVLELLEKIEEMVAGNHGAVYGTPRKTPKNKGGSPRDDSGRSSDSDSESEASDVKVTDITKEYVSKIPFVNEDVIKIKQYIEAGSFGRVYRGSYQGTPVAVKTIPIKKYHSATLEVVIPLCLSHPHIVRMIAVCKKEHELLIAYEYIHGADLDQIIHSDHPIKLDEEDKMAVALEIGMAVEYIHGRDIIHQDIKPANILLSKRTKTAYLTDWGLANIKDTQACYGVAASGPLRGPRSTGTPMYMGPELLLDNKRCSRMSDMWSLGLAYLEMFTGFLPWTLNNRHALHGLLFKKKRPHALADLQSHLKEIVEPLVQYKPQSRMTATDLVTRLKSKVDLVKRYDYDW